MKKIIGALGCIMLLGCSTSKGQDVTTVTAKSVDISQNLDLQAVASVFGDSKDLEDFERRINDPNSQISNLDLNNDGQVDYLRVVENSEGNTHVITIQSMLSKDVFQDVATVNVEKSSSGSTQVQVVGDVYMYGPSYVITPVYVYPPVIYTFFWGPMYRPWVSPYYWGYYPPYYRPWRPYPVHTYQKNVRVNINVNNSYRYDIDRRSKTAINIDNNNRRNDYGRQNPNNSFEKRNSGVTNARSFDNDSRTSSQTRTGSNSSSNRVTGTSTTNSNRTGTTNNNRTSTTENKGAGTSSVRQPGTSTPQNKKSSYTRPSNANQSVTTSPNRSVPPTATSRSTSVPTSSAKRSKSTSRSSRSSSSTKSSTTRSSGGGTSSRRR